MTFTLDLSSMLAVASAIVAIGGALTVLSNAKKKLDKPIIDINTKLKNDNRRINDLEMKTDELKSDSVEMLEAMLLVLRHLRTNNATGEMREKEHDLINYLAEKRRI